MTGERDRPKVVLYADCFVTYNEPNIGVAAVRVLESLGYEVLLPKIGCCGRAMISTGLLPDAIRAIDDTVRMLESYVYDPNVRAIVAAEPSCLSAIKDDWLQLQAKTELPLRKKIAAKSFLVEEFVDRFWDEHPAKPRVDVQTDGPPVILHGHCHQKALWGDETSAAAIRRVVGDSRLWVLPSGCCGMAGSFGYIDRRYDLSMRIGELTLFPPLRSAPGDAIVIAPGTSCRHQIHDGVGRRAIHPVEFLASALSPAPAPPAEDVDHA
jgi:Fe-S oxidoreductase